MNSKGIVAIPESKTLSVCMNCLQEYKKIVCISIPEMGYGSGFDGFGTQVHLCKECYEKSSPDIWKLEVVKDDYCEEYKHESQIFEYLNRLPLQSRELVYNTYTHGFNANYSMEQQDWIDFYLDELPHDRCKEYGRYSPEERKAYTERFPTCQYPYHRVYQDGSRGCWCALHHAYGEYGQKCRRDISDKCYLCKEYRERTSVIRDIADVDTDDYELYVKMTLHQAELDKKFS